MAKKTTIPELSAIEINGSEDLAKYSEALRQFGHSVAWELETTAEDVQARLAMLKGHPLLLGVDVKIRARRVANRLRRARELANGISAEAVKFWVTYKQQFVEASTQEEEKKKGWEL